jgi:DNA repair protein RadC
MNIQILTVKKTTGVCLTCAWDVFKLMRVEALADREHLWVIHLNSESKVIEKELVAIGTPDSVPAICKLIFRKAVINNSSYIVMVHNHPSGPVKPSESDMKIHKVSIAAGSILGIELLDSVILGPSGYCSTRLYEIFGFAPMAAINTPHSRGKNGADKSSLCPPQKSITTQQLSLRF